MKREVAIWIRVSTDEQAKGDSPAVHMERAKGYATAKDWHVSKIYDLSGTSGKSVINHPETQRMLADIASGSISALIFSKLARLSRNAKEVLQIADEFDKAGANLVSVDENLDTSTPAGRLVFTMMAAMAQAEREEIASRVAASVPIRAKMGKCLGGAAPYGYQWLNGVLTPDPKEAPIRKLMYELYMNIRTLKGVASALNKRGYRTRNGGEFRASSVRRSLTDTTSKGVRIANYTKSRGDGQSWDLKPEEDWVRIPVEPIVDEELWEQCNALISESAKKYLSESTNRGKVKYLFSGVVYCGNCGGKQKLYPRTGEHTYVCQKCLEKIPKEVLETLFIQQASSFLIDENKVAEVLEKQTSKYQEALDLLKISEDRLLQVTNKITGCLELFHADAIGINEVKIQMKPLEEQKEELTQSISEQQEAVRMYKQDTTKVAEIIADGQSLAEEWEKFDFDRKRSIIESMIERITVKGKEITFDLVYLKNIISPKKGVRNFKDSMPPPTGTDKGTSDSLRL